MSLKSSLSEWCSRWFGSSKNGYHTVLGILRSRYADEREHFAKLSQHAKKMQYPQFREALLRIASDESKHADWIAQKIEALGGVLPFVGEVESTEKTAGNICARIWKKSGDVRRS